MATRNDNRRQIGGNCALENLRKYRLRSVGRLESEIRKPKAPKLSKRGALQAQVAALWSVASRLLKTS
jgi:hypothetical protein